MADVFGGFKLLGPFNPLVLKPSGTKEGVPAISGELDGNLPEPVYIYCNRSSAAIGTILQSA